MSQWTNSQIQQALSILKKYPATRYHDALREISRVLGKDVTRHSLYRAFMRYDLNTPVSYCEGGAHVGGHSTQKVESPKGNSLLSYATAEERKALKALEAHGSINAAAAALNITEEALRSRVRRASKRAASRGWAPEYNWKHPVPDGHRIRGNSTRYDGAGNVDQQWVKSERDSDDPPAVEAVPPGHTIKKVSTLLDGQGKIRAQWLQAPKDEQTRWEEFWAACERNAKQYKGIAEPVKAPKYNDEDTCTVYPLGDPHIGMLAWAKETGQDFDLQIAERDLIRAIDLLVDRAPPSKRAVLANVGDFFHAENDDQKTPTGGNKLDCDTRWAKITDVGFHIMRHLIDRLLEKHAFVEVVNVPGNHDPRMARMMNMWLSVVYEKENRASIKDNRSPYLYIKHGRNLLGFAHGDGAKPEQLPGIMAADQPSDWGDTDYRMWFTGHIHHQTRKEYPGCVIESFRTLAARDYWHSWKGYRSGQSLSCITLHEEYGEITRSTVDIKLVRADIAK